MAAFPTTSLLAWALMILTILQEFASAGPVFAESSLPTVNLGYATYTGFLDNTTGLNNFRGIRYAAPPVGSLRWQKPQPPVNQTEPISLSANWPPACPQSPGAPFTPSPTPDSEGNEDCLYLSIIAPPDARDLPVLFFIHGGGYGSGHGSSPLVDLTKNNDNGFVYVSVQYRLGAFGFLSSAAMSGRGTANAGLWDMQAALKWVNTYISIFGGDPNRVTIAGESAGGGAVMTLVMAQGGTWGTSLFRNALVSSPYLPQQYDFDAPQTESLYASFATAAGCVNKDAPADNATVFACLQAADSETLQKANQYVNSIGRYGSWAFLPVTDGDFLRDLPSVQLRTGSVNGARFLSGNNANEAPIFVPAVPDKKAFAAYSNASFPLMSENQLEDLAEIYAIDPVVPDKPLFATLGNSGPTALNQSSFAVGYQQAADNLYAETTFICPSYWLSNAFGRSGGQSWHYQFSVPPSQHAGDLNGFYAADSVSPGDGTVTEYFRIGMQKMWGNFIINDNPTLSREIITQLAGENGINGAFDAASSCHWKPWSGGPDGSPMLNLNMTGGVEVQRNVTFLYGETVNLTQYAGPGLSVAWTLVDGYAWEGGRGKRCDALADIGAIIPE